MSGQTEPAESEVRDRLRALRVDPPAGDFAASLHRRLAAEGLPAAPGLLDRLRDLSRRPWIWSAAAFAAGVLVVLAYGVARRPMETGSGAAPLAGNERLQPPTSDATAVVPASKVAVITLRLSTEVAAPNALIQVKLPDGLAFWSHGEALAQSSFSWTQSLTPGDNEIPIAVRGMRAGRYRVAVTADTGNDEVRDEVVLEVTGG
jgi:hypothetical protein